jgi:hypothetical protein
MIKNVTIPFHPIPFTLFPVLSLYTANANQLSFGDVLPTMLIVLAITMLAWMALFGVVRDSSRSAIAISLVVFLFFSYAHFLTLFAVFAGFLNRYQSIRTLVETRNGMLFWIILGMLVVGVCILWVTRTNRNLNLLTKLLNFLSMALVVMVLPTWASTLISQGQAQSVIIQGDGYKGNLEHQTSFQSIRDSSRQLPDIYYIILDGYGRSDVLKEIYDLDNQEFLNSLESRGFFVADKSYSNYPRTGLSVASSLNMTYLDEFSDQLGAQSENLFSLKPLIENNLVFKKLRQAGYTIVAFSSGYLLTEISSADQIFAYQRTPDNFQNILINNTPLSLFLLGKQYDWHRERIKFSLNQLPELSRGDQPIFVFVHILAPHPPFVFGPNGESIYPPRAYGIHDGGDFLMLADREEYLQGYGDQAVFISKAVIGAVERILESSTIPPVIIIQGDHGPRSSLEPGILDQASLVEYMMILNAYHMPQIDPNLLKPGITPVNTFRLLFNTYLGTNYRMLEDRSYYSTNDQPFMFTEITRYLRNYPAQD